MTAPVLQLSSLEAAAAQLRAQIVAYSAAMWATATLTDETVDRLVEVFAPTVVAAQMHLANLVSAYFASVTGTPPVPVDELVTLGRGVPNSVVYARPVVTARSLIAQGKAPAEAFEAGGRRLESIATTDLQMAKVRQADLSLQAAGVKHYRRVPKGAGTCAMCLIASTRRYNTGELAPIHPGCDCGVDILTPGHDLDEVLDVDLLNATHAKVKDFTGVEDRGGKAVDYRKLIITQEHGEIGPLVAWRGDHFEGPFDAVDLDAAPKRKSVFNPDQRTAAPTRGDRSPSFVGGGESSPERRASANRSLADILATIED